MATDLLRSATFQELIDEGTLEIGDGYRAKNNELGGSGPIFLRAGHVTDSHIDFAGVERFHENLRDRLAQKFAKSGDTNNTTKGNSTGRTSFVADRMPEWHTDDAYLRKSHEAEAALALQQLGKLDIRSQIAPHSERR